MSFINQLTNGYKKYLLKILKKLKATGTVTNLPGRGPMFISPHPCERDDKRGK